MNNCDQAIVLFSKHTLEMKQMPILEKEEVVKNFGKDDLKVFDNLGDFKSFVSGLSEENSVFYS